MQRVLTGLGKWAKRNSGIMTAMICVLLMMTVVAMCTGHWAMNGYNPYNSYERQADAWLHGHLELVDGPHLQWLELAIYEGKYYVSFPPFPSYVMLPFVAAMGLNETPDGLVALAVAMLGVIYACRLYRLVTGSEENMLLLVLFLLLGNGWVFLTVTGWVWFFAQNLCFTLSLMALYYACLGKGGWSLGCWACSVGCRPMMALYLPLLLWCLIRALRKKHIGMSVFGMVRRYLYWILPPAVIGGSYMALNYLRFGSVLEFGHNYLPEFMRLPTGQFSLTYFWNNFLTTLRLPVWYGESSAVGLHGQECMAFWMVNSILVLASAAWVWALAKKRRGLGFTLAALPVMVIAHVFILCCHHTMGAQQFGNRYLVDFLPYVFFGMLLWMPKKEWFTRLCLPLACFGTALNLVGTIMSYNHVI